ncbi:cell division control protein 16 [Ephemerocybe angulata]|uniref:Cell division control protein 16 n=1 Tax=Ephemerocybe angulata TaxID=980116 RepID=A0A8H6HYW7_9AGAR|nr:cell division control protein 16 [Tulosesus angulatus]
MTSTPPPSNAFSLPPIPTLPSPSASGRPRGSIGLHFLFQPFTDHGLLLRRQYEHLLPADAHRARPQPLDPGVFAGKGVPASPNGSQSSARDPGAAIRRGWGWAAQGVAGGTRHPLANDTTDVFNDSEDDADDEESSYEWGMVDRMRLWRHDALMQHLYETAAFWGDKILSWTRPIVSLPGPSPHPRLPRQSLQLPFSNPQSQSQHPGLLFPAGTSTPAPSAEHHLNGATNNGKGKHRESIASFLFGSNDESDRPQGPMSMARLPVGPAGLVDVPEPLLDRTSRLVDMSLACRYLAAQCMVRSGKWTEAMELIGEANPFRGSAQSGPAIANTDGGIKIEASMCYLRGMLMLKLNRADQAKTCFMEALSLDVKCADAFSQLVNAEMLAPDEEWEFIQGLSYATQTPEDAEFVQLIYTSRLRKDKHQVEHALTRSRLVDDYGLGDNPDVLFSFADALYTDFRWAECYAVTSRIMGLTAIHVPTLFLLAHEMVDREPENALSWYAVGVWYLSSGKWGQARSYLSKTTLMDPRFAPAWAAFGHTFAMEAEHDHAVTAYFDLSHLPLLFIGMEQIMLSNFRLADEALGAAAALCQNDPLLCNERGVMAFNHGDYQQAANLFQEAIDRAQVTQSSEQTWAITYMNLGTCFRKLKKLDEAVKVYHKVLEYEPRHSMALGFLGMVYHMLGDLGNAIEEYHKALAIDPINTNIVGLLESAMDTSNAKSAVSLRESDLRKALHEKWKREDPQYRAKWAARDIAMRDELHAREMGVSLHDINAMQEG